MGTPVTLRQARSFLIFAIAAIGELPHIGTAKKYASPIGKLNAT
jgi:hypothetical protein